MCQMLHTKNMTNTISTNVSSVAPTNSDNKNKRYEMD